VIGSMRKVSHRPDLIASNVMGQVRKGLSGSMMSKQSSCYVSQKIVFVPHIGRDTRRLCL